MYVSIRLYMYIYIYILVLGYICVYTVCYVLTSAVNIL